MTIEELRAACDAAKKASIDPLAKPGFPLVLDRPAGPGRRMRVAPGLSGDLLCENCDGKAVVRVLVADVERWLGRFEKESAP